MGSVCEGGNQEEGGARLEERGGATKEAQVYRGRSEVCESR